MSIKPQSSFTKKQLKEKVVQIYEALFKGEDLTLQNGNFWNEFFLLRPNITVLENIIEKLDDDKILQYKHIIGRLFYQCVQVLQEDNQIRTANSLQTMGSLVRGTFKKSAGDYGFGLIDILIGFENAEHTMQVLIEQCNEILTSEAFSGVLKSICLKFLLIIATVVENISQNTLLEYIMMNSVFESLIQLLADSSQRQYHGRDAVLLLLILVNYRKYESVNSYIVKLSILDDELALNGYGQILAMYLADYNRNYALARFNENKSGILSTITSMVGSIFIAEDQLVSKDLMTKSNDAFLLALYEATHLNRNFVSTFVHSQTDTSGPPSPAGTLEPGLSAELVAVGDESIINLPPANLLTTFIEYCSIVMQNTKEDCNMNTIKLSFIILACIAEDQYANSLMHDPNMVFKVRLHRMKMRHRKTDLETTSHAQPLACALLDLMVEFMMSHMMKNFPNDLYIRSVSIIHRLLCYQKKCRVRLRYSWKPLWAALIAVLGFLVANENALLRKHNIFVVLMQIVNIFNLFITFGDTFLPTPSSYDELYYELIRVHQVFDNLQTIVNRYASNDGSSQEYAAKLGNNLINIRAIINHFNPKISAWAADQHISTLTEDQVLEVVRNNYETLTLKLYDTLDQYERYSEKPKETAFFMQMVRNMVTTIRSNLVPSMQLTDTQNQLLCSALTCQTQL